MGQLQVMQERVQELFLSSGGKVTGLPGRISGVPCGTADHSAHESVWECKTTLRWRKKYLDIWSGQKTADHIWESAGRFLGTKESNWTHGCTAEQPGICTGKWKTFHHAAAVCYRLIALANILVYIILSFGGATEDCVLYGIERLPCIPEFLTIQSSVVAFIDSNVFTFWSDTSDE